MATKKKSAKKPSIRMEAFDFQKIVLEAVTRLINVLLIAPMGAGKTRAAHDAMEFRGGGCIVVQGRSLSWQHYLSLIARFGKDLCVIGTGINFLRHKQFIQAKYRVITMFRLIIYAMTIKNFAKVCPLLVLDEIDEMNPFFQLGISLIRYLHPEVQILAMTGTIHEADIEDVCKWLGAEVVESNIRPIDVVHYGVFFKRVGGDTKVYINGQLMKTIKSEVIGPGPRAMEVIYDILRKQGNKDTQVFFQSPRRRTTRSMCDWLIEKVMSKGEEIEDLAKKAKRMRGAKNHDFFLLKKGLPFGVGLHHGGLDHLLCRMVERLSAAGLLKTVFSCLSLIRGTDHPFTDVVLYGLWDPDTEKPLKTSTYWQIACRCGRSSSMETHEAHQGTVWVPVFSESELELFNSVYMKYKAPRMNRSMGRAFNFGTTIIGLAYFGKQLRMNFQNFLKDFTLWGIKTSDEKVASFLEEAFSFSDNPTEKSGGDELQLIWSKFYQEKLELSKTGKAAARFGFHPMEFEISVNYLAGKFTYAEYLNNLSHFYLESTGVELSKEEVKQVVMHGLGVLRRHCSWDTKEFAQYVERVMSRLVPLMEHLGTEKSTIDEWWEESLWPFLAGSSNILLGLSPWVKQKPLVELAIRGGKMLDKPISMLTDGNLEHIALRLYQDAESAPIDENLIHIAAVLRVEQTKWVEIISRVDTRKEVQSA